MEPKKNTPLTHSRARQRDCQQASERHVSCRVACRVWYGMVMCMSCVVSGGLPWAAPARYTKQRIAADCAVRELFRSTHTHTQREGSEGEGRPADGPGAT